MSEIRRPRQAVTSVAAEQLKPPARLKFKVLLSILPQICSVMKDAPLTWEEIAQNHLDRVQSRAINSAVPGTTNNLQSCRHRRNVASLTVMFKIQTEQVTHLQSLRQPVRRTTRITRAVERLPVALEQPRCKA